MAIDRTPIITSPLNSNEDMNISPNNSDIEMHTPYLDYAKFSPHFNLEESKIEE